MIRAVIDTNVLISALFWAGAPRRVVDLAAARRFRSLTSPELLAELEEVLAEDFGVPQQQLDLIVRDVLSYAEVVTPDEDIPVAVRDLSDIKVIACALAGRADLIITGDADLLTLGQVDDVRIVTVRGFLRSHLW